MATVALVPLKSLADAKQRLADELSASDRVALTLRLFHHVLRACMATSVIDGVITVAGDQAGAREARAAGAQALVEPRRGLNLALRTATSALPPDDVTLVVVADLPFVRPGDLAMIVEAGREGPCVVVAPTADRGTAALLRNPGTVIPTSYGPHSAAAHLRTAQRAGVRAARITIPRLTRDLDRPSDLEALDGGGLSSAANDTWPPADPPPGVP